MRLENLAPIEHQKQTTNYQHLRTYFGQTMSLLLYAAKKNNATGQCQQFHVM